MPAKAEKYSYLKGKDYEDVPNCQLKTSALWRGFQENTSGHGLNRLYLTPGIAKKVLWIIICIGGFAAWGIHTTTLLVNFFHYHVAVTVKVMSAPNLTFPAVTVCNLNQVRVNYLGELVNLTQIYDQAAAYNEDGEGDLGEMDILNEYQYLLQSALSDEPLKARTTIGHQLDDFILKCTYKGFECAGNVGFQLFYDPKFGNCFTFNKFNGNQSDILFSHSTGPENGLTMILNIEQDEYLPFSESAGIRLVVHNNSVMPFPADEGINIGPGKLAMVGMRQVQIMRVGDPHGKCVNASKPDPKRNLYDHFHDEYGTVWYSYQACRKSCYQTQVMEQCKCFDSNYPEPRNLSESIDVCAFGSVEQDECQDRVQYEFSQGYLYCDCPLPCQESTHVLTTSSSQWPSDAYKDTLFAQLTLMNNTNVNDILAAADKQVYTRNFLKVKVYFEDLNYEEIEQNPAYTGSSLISDLGGSIGLWIGWSVITIVELFEFISDVIVLSCSNKSKRVGSGELSINGVKM